MLDSKLDKLIKATKEDRFNAYRYLILAAGFEDEGKVQCGRNQHDPRHEFCCAEWAYMRAWVLWPKTEDEDREFVATEKGESGEVHFKEKSTIEEEVNEQDAQYRSLPPALELGRIRGWESKERLVAGRLEELADPENRTVTEIIEELGKLAHPDSVGPLLVQFANPMNEVGVRAAAAKTLAVIGDPIAVPTLIRNLSSGATRTTHDMIYKTTLSDLLTGDQEQKDAYLLAAVIEALGIYGDPKAVRPLRQAMKSKYTAVREATAIAMGHIGGEEAELALARRAGDIKTRVVRAAQKALSSLEDPAVHASMIIAEFLKDPTRSLDKTGRALLECGAHAVTMLLEILPGAEDELRELGARVLSNIGDTGALEEMLAALEDPDPSVRIQVAEALANNPHRPGRAVAVLKQLRESDSEESVREAADSAIEKIMEGMF